MRFSIKKKLLFNKSYWHDHFAWFPITIGLVVVWLEIVQRRTFDLYNPFNTNASLKYEYRFKPSASEAAIKYGVGIVYQHNTLSGHSILRMSEDTWLCIGKGPKIPLGPVKELYIERYRSEDTPTHIQREYHEV